MAIGSGKSSRYLGMWAYDQAQSAKKEGQEALDTAQGNSLESLGQGYTQARDDATKYYTQATDRLNNWSEKGSSALDAYYNSLGLGGQEGYDSTVSTYRESPGYAAAVKAAEDSVMRNASASGVLGSGNTVQAVSDRARDMKDQDYGNWQNQLKGLSDSGQQAATQQGQWDASLGNTLASLGQSQGRDESDAYKYYSGLGQNNLWNATNSGINSVTNAGKQAQGNVASGYSFGVNAAGSILKLLGLA